MKAIILHASLVVWALLSPPVNAQSERPPFPLAGDWEGVLISQGTRNHLVLHLSTTSEGKMTALLDNVDQHITGLPPIDGSFDGRRLVLRFSYGKLNSNRDIEYKIATYEATVNTAGSELTGVWEQEASLPLSFNRLTWQAKVPKPEASTIFDGDWAGIEDTGEGRKIHFLLHLHNTEEGLIALLDCPEERFKGALASRVSYDENLRQISINIFQATFTGRMSQDGKVLETSMIEPGYKFLIRFDRQSPKKPKDQE